MNELLFAKLQNFRGQLNSAFLERETIIDGVLASMITQQNCFLFGAPGTGKSELVRAAAKGFEGNKFFSYLLSPTTDPSELYGPVAVSKLLQDEYTRDISGYLPDANVAFLDELFRGSSAVLNSLLQLLNERTFNNGKDLVKTDIQSIVAATNSFPTEESLQAFCDRFLFRPTVEGLKRAKNKRLLYRWAVNGTRPVINSELTSEDLKELQKQVNNVTISDEFVDIFVEVTDMLESRGIKISDRRRVQVLKFLRGWAIVQGEDSVFPEYLHSTFKHIVYQTQEDIPVIKDVLDQCVPTADKYFRDARRAADSIMADFLNEMRDQASVLTEVNAKVLRLKEFLRDMKTITGKAEQALDSDTMKMSADMRLRAMKITQELTNNCERIAQAINRYQSN